MTENVTTDAIDDDLPVLEFPDGIPGFPGARHWVLSDVDDAGTLQMLSSVDDTGLSMIVAVPWLFFPDYTPVLSDEQQEDLALTSSEDAVVFCSVSADPDDDAVFLNLLGPFIVNARTRQGRQVVLDDADQSPRARVPLESVADDREA